VRVLFVDDEPNILSGVSRMLLVASPEIDVELAASGAEALGILQAETVDVVVTDMRMPVMDGMQLLVKVRERWPNIVRIVLTGETSHEKAVRMVPIAHQYLLKPCSGEEMVGVIARTQAVLARLDDSNMRELVGGLSALPSLPETYRRLSEALDNPSTPSAQIARIIESDPPIALKLLQLANSAFFSRRIATNDVAGAVVQMGVDTIRHVVLQLAAFQIGATARPSVQLHLRELQGRALRVANCASELVPSASQRAHAFMAGLLCDIGQVVLATVQEERWANVIANANKSARPLEVVEREILGVSHAEVGALLMGVWGLPHFAVESAACHHDGDSLTSSKLDIVGAVCLANLLVDAKKGDPGIWDRPNLRSIVDGYWNALEQRGMGQ
jgi:HD-like signal output (HDOD) protein/CheY-like chemotaxis protein